MNGLCALGSVVVPLDRGNCSTGGIWAARELVAALERREREVESVTGGEDIVACYGVTLSGLEIVKTEADLSLPASRPSLLGVQSLVEQHLEVRLVPQPFLGG